MLFRNSSSNRRLSSSTLKRRLGFQLIFLVVIAAMMLAFFSRGSDRKVDITTGRAVEDRLSGGIFDIQGPEDEDRAATGPAKTPDELDPFAESSDGSSGEAVEKSELQPFVEDPLVLHRAAARDGTAKVSHKGNIEEEGVAYLAHRVLWEKKTGATSEPVLSTIKRDRVWRRLLEDPHRHRGELVEVRGNLLRAGKNEETIRPRALRAFHRAQLGDVDRLYRAYFVDEDDSDGPVHHYLVYITEDQREEMSHLAPVIFRGYFCRVYRGEYDHGGQIRHRDIPVLVGSRFEKFSTPPLPSFNALQYMPIVLGLLALAALVIWGTTRRSEATFEARRAEARRGFAEKRSAGETRSIEPGPIGVEPTAAPDGDPESGSEGLST